MRANLSILEASGTVTGRDVAVIMTAEDANDAAVLYAHGADYVFVPRLFGGEHIAELLTVAAASRGDLRKSIARFRETAIRT
jgi:hypothetical protein